MMTRKRNVRVFVKPNSMEEKVEKVSENEYLIWLREPARAGKANARLIKIIAKEFGVADKGVVLKTSKGRKKVVEILK